MSQEDAVSYLRDILNLNPQVAPEFVLSRRAAFLGTASAAASDPVSGDRAACLKRLADLRGSFWKITRDEFDRRGSELALSGYDDIRRAVTRLDAMNGLREPFEELRKVCEFEEITIFNKLREALTLSDRESRRFWIAFVADMRPRESRAARRVFKRIKRFHPELRAEIENSPLIEYRVDRIFKRVRFESGIAREALLKLRKGFDMTMIGCLCFLSIVAACILFPIVFS